MILGIGIDAASISRVERELDLDPEWQNSVFTPAEVGYCMKMQRPAQHYAARFAAKEAFLKALPEDALRGFNWRDIEISRQPSGQPQISLRGGLEAFAAALQIRTIFLSISHTRDLAIASVVIEADPMSTQPPNQKDAE